MDFRIAGTFADIRRILASGVDGIMSDRPDVLREVVAEFAGAAE